MKRILTVAGVCLLLMMVGVGLGLMGLGWRGDGDTAAAPMALLSMFVAWVIISLMIGQVLPRRPKAATISAMVKRATRVVVTPALCQQIVAAYIGDGQPSIRDVARLVHCSYGTVHRVVTEAGVMRPRGLTRMAQRAQTKAAGA